jgi:intracellular sulfur oxidation DsrE/DsrF family protein
MSQDKCFSDEFLNAFVDNQITAEEESRAYIEIGQDETLNRRVCELRKLHDLVQLAYSEPPAPPTRAVVGMNSRQARLCYGVAASVLLTLGIVLSSQIRMSYTAPSVTTVSAVAIQTSARITPPAMPKMTAIADVPAHVTSLQPVAAIPANESAAVPAPVIARDEILDKATAKVLIHIARDDADQLSQALDDIEGLLKLYRETRQSARVEVVVNGKGLELVRTDTSAFAGRIQHLQREFDNLTFAACQNTIDRLAEQGIIVRLLPGVMTIDSGMAEIMRRQNQGWSYLQV